MRQSPGPAAHTSLAVDASFISENAAFPPASADSTENNGVMMQPDERTDQSASTTRDGIEAIQFAENKAEDRGDEDSTCWSTTGTRCRKPRFARGGNLREVDRDSRRVRRRRKIPEAAADQHDTVVQQDRCSRYVGQKAITPVPSP